MGQNTTHKLLGGEEAQQLRKEPKTLRIKAIAKGLAGPFATAETASDYNTNAACGNMSMVITDRYDHSIDEKNRLAIPSQVRNAMDTTIDGNAFYIVPAGRYLELIPEKLFTQLAGAANAGLAVSPEVARVRRLIFASASRLDMDKAGRVVIPDRFMADSKNRDPFSDAMLGRDVTLVGANDRLELWNRNDFYAHMRELLADRGALQQTMQQLFTKPATGNDNRPF